MKTTLRKSLGVFFIFSTVFVLSLFFTNCGKINSQTAQDSSSQSVNDVGSNFSGQITSQIQSITKLGTVSGYAMDPQNTGSTLRVIFYADGPAGAGTYLGETQANIASYGTYAGHFFSFKIPAAYSDGKSHTLYVYGHDTRPELLLKPNSMSFVAYTPKAETVFNQQIKNFIAGNCMGCHGSLWTYSAMYSGPLLTPTPATGGTATNNTFIRKMSGLTDHAGGQFCSGGVNSDICLEIQKWWNAEFN